MVTSHGCICLLSRLSFSVKRFYWHPPPINGGILPLINFGLISLSKGISKKNAARVALSILLAPFILFLIYVLIWWPWKKKQSFQDLKKQAKFSFIKIICCKKNCQLWNIPLIPMNFSRVCHQLKKCHLSTLVVEKAKLSSIGGCQKLPTTRGCLRQGRKVRISIFNLWHSVPQKILRPKPTLKHGIKILRVCPEKNETNENLSRDENLKFYVKN